VGRIDARERDVRRAEAGAARGRRRAGQEYRRVAKAGSHAARSLAARTRATSARTCGHLLLCRITTFAAALLAELRKRNAERQAQNPFG
jgi:hypothetical protein